MFFLISLTIMSLPFRRWSMNVVKVDDYLEKSSLTGPEIFMVVFAHEMEEGSAKK